jgi:REP element-mobilizing transposase RayT
VTRRPRAIYKAMRDATITAAMRERFRIVHVSIQRTHVHMLVEAENTRALSRGMQGFEISAARNINTMLGSGKRRRCGQVFAGRYHVEVITSPRRARHALNYLLNNWRKHREDQQGLASTWLIDPFSTGILFPDWKELADKDFMWPIREPTIRWWYFVRVAGFCERPGSAMARSRPATCRAGPADPRRASSRPAGCRPLSKASWQTDVPSVTSRRRPAWRALSSVSPSIRKSWVQGALSTNQDQSS